MRTPNPLSLRAAHLIATLLLVVCVSVVSAHGSSRSATLEAIHKLENPLDLSRPGSRGELGPYQFRASTWRMHTSAPFEQAVERSVSDAVAVKHYEWLKRGLEAAHMPATAYNIALAWNSGLSATVSGRSPGVSHNYAERVSNLAATIDAKPLKLFASSP